jgi:hypothetical protein
MNVESSANGIESGKRQKNRDRVNKRFELRRQNQIHKDEREQKRVHKRAVCALQLLRLPGHARRVFGRQVEFHDVGFELGDRVRFRSVLRQPGAHRDLSLPIQTVDGRRRAAFFDLDEFFQTDRTAV